VSLETSDAIVIYDPRVTKVESLVAAVDAATGPQSERQYRAEVKVGPRAASAR
jgi:hypothetical protein